MKSGLVVRGGWVLAFHNGQHELVPDGVCVVEGDRIQYAGPSLPTHASGNLGQEIDARGRLIIPGLISTHTHTSIGSGDAVFLDPRRHDAGARNYLNWLAPVRGRARARPDPLLNAAFGLAQALRSGTTTLVDFGAASSVDAFADAVRAVGIRAYTGLGYRNSLIQTDEDGRFLYDWDEMRGSEGLATALHAAAEMDGTVDDRLRAILCPGHPDLTSFDLLSQTADQALDHGWPISIHAGINPGELTRTLDSQGMTSIEILDRAGLLGPTTIVCHAVFIRGHSWTPYGKGSDLELLGERGATVSYSPLKYAHVGATLESFQSYLRAGVNVTVGTDFAPRDIVREMRLAMLSSRISDRDFRSGEPQDVFTAATLNAARALGRDDLGRLAPGAKADVVIVDLDALHFGPIHDPIKSFVENGSSSDIETVIVDGQIVVNNHRLAMLDETELLASARTEACRLWDDIPRWIWGGATIDEVAPPSFPFMPESWPRARRN